MELRIPWYIHGNWKLDTNQLDNLEQELIALNAPLYQSTLRNVKALAFLNSFYKEIVDGIAKEQTFYNNSEIRYEYWVQVYNKKQCHRPHTHFGINNNTILSWVHFLKIPEPNCFRFTDETRYEIPEQKEGDLLVFPSYVLHEAVEHTSENSRIVIAGNISLMSHINEKESN